MHPIGMLSSIVIDLCHSFIFFVFYYYYFFFQSLLILGCLRILGRGVVFDDIAEAIATSEAVIQAFFHVFVQHFSTEQFDRFVKWPTTQEDLEQCEREYAMGGLNGCIGSADVCHVSWDRCNISLTNGAKGKEGYPTIGYRLFLFAQGLATRI